MQMYNKEQIGGKAKELIEKMWEHTGGIWLGYTEHSKKKEITKQCAQIAVDEKIKLLQFWIDNDEFTNAHCKKTRFGTDVLTVFQEEIYDLQQVKQEIEKL